MIKHLFVSQDQLWLIRILCPVAYKITVNHLVVRTKNLLLLRSKAVNDLNFQE